MKRCKMCGAAMRIDAELTEGQRQYTWHKCLNINCGAIFLMQRPIPKTAEADPPNRANAAAG